MLIENAGCNVRNSFCGGERRISGNRKLHTHTSGRCADDDNFVCVLGCGDFSGKYVKKGVHRKGGLTVSSLVELRQHEGRLIRFDLQFTNLD
jgi:hypothetical protein